MTKCAMAASRLPVHLFFDIDETLVYPLRSRNGCSGGCSAGRGLGELCSHAVTEGPCPLFPYPAAPMRWPLHNVEGRIHEVLLRPHVEEFLSYVLLDRKLDTDRTEVFVSLWTRQSASYCSAIAQQVLVPALTQHAGAAFHTAGVSKRLFEYFLSGADCVCCAADAELPANELSSVRPPSSTAGEEKKWKTPQIARESWEGSTKMICCVSPHPLTTVLIDDKCANFNIDEIRSGHGILVPPYDAFAVRCATDDCFTLPAHDPQDRVRDQDGGASAIAMHRPLQQDAGTGDDASQLVDVLHAFVQCCHRHHDLLGELQRRLTATEGHGSQHRTTGTAPSHKRTIPLSVWKSFNLFELSPLYRRRWNFFHGDREHELSSFFTT